MELDWGPHFIVPSEASKDFTGIVRLREELDEGLLRKELEALGLDGAIIRISNPWYYRRKGTKTWIKIGESIDRHENFPVKWDTSPLPNGSYEVLGLMHVTVHHGDAETIIARQQVVEVNVTN